VRQRGRERKRMAPLPPADVVTSATERERGGEDESGGERDGARTGEIERE